MFLQIKDRKHIEQNFLLLPLSCPKGGTWDAGGGGGGGGVRNFSMGLCDGAPSTACSSFNLL